LAPLPRITERSIRPAPSAGAGRTPAEGVEVRDHVFAEDAFKWARAQQAAERLSHGEGYSATPVKFAASTRSVEVICAVCWIGAADRVISNESQDRPTPSQNFPDRGVERFSEAATRNVIPLRRQLRRAHPTS
jgi:hypothetical protein